MDHDKDTVPLNRIEEQFFNRFLNRDGILLISKINAISMVRMCLQENIQILGIDEFWIANNAIQPSLENSVDFSSKELQASYIDPVFRDPREFLKTRDDKRMFEIVCAD